MNKSQKTYSGQNWKIIRMAFSKFPKTKKYSKTKKVQKLHIKKNIWKGFKWKTFRKQNIVKMKNIKNDIFLNFKN